MAVNCAGFTFDKFCCFEFSAFIISVDSVTKHSADFHSTPWNEIAKSKRNIKWEILLMQRATAEITTKSCKLSVVSRYQVNYLTGYIDLFSPNR